MNRLVLLAVTGALALMLSACDQKSGSDKPQTINTEVTVPKNDANKAEPAPAPAAPSEKPAE